MTVSKALEAMINRTVHQFLWSAYCVLPLLPECRDVAADAAEVVNSGIRAETTGYLQAHSGDAQVTLRRIIVERHPKVEGEMEYGGLISQRPLQRAASMSRRAAGTCWPACSRGLLGHVAFLINPSLVGGLLLF